MDEQRALTFLKKGLPPSQVATIIGVSPGRVSQFLSREDVKLEIEAARLESEGKDQEEVLIETKMTGLKGSLLDAMMKRQDEATYMELVRSFEILSRAQEAKKNPIPLQGGPVFNNTQVLITVPERLVQHAIQITNENEVIAIGDRALAPLPAARVTKLFEEMKNERSNLLAEPKESSAAVVQAA